MNQHDASHFIPIIFFAVAQVIFGNIPFMLKMKSYSKFLLVVLNLFLSWPLLLMFLLLLLFLFRRRRSRFHLSIALLTLTPISILLLMLFFHCIHLLHSLPLPVIVSGANIAVLVIPIHFPSCSARCYSSSCCHHTAICLHILRTDTTFPNYAINM
jgi:hypothetical protein